MALPSSGDISLQAIITEIFGSFSANDFQTCINASLLTDKTLPVPFKPNFQGYVDDITFTASPSSLSFAYNDSTRQESTIIVDTRYCHIHSVPAWVNVKGSDGIDLNPSDVLDKIGTPSFVLSILPSNNGGVDRSDNVVIHLTSAIGNAYQTQSGTSLNIPIYQAHLPVPPYLMGFTIAYGSGISSLGSTAARGISLGSNNIYADFTPSGSFTTGLNQIQVYVGTERLHNSTIYMASGVDVINTSLALNRTLAEDEAVEIRVGDDYS